MNRGEKKEEESAFVGSAFGKRGHREGIAGDG